jgi:hypothetical protein
MNDSRDAVYIVAAIAAAAMAIAITAFYVVAFFCPVIFRLGTAAERIHYLACHVGLFTLARDITFAWIFVEIPVGVGIYYLVKERDPSRAGIGAPFWFVGIFCQFVAYSLMFNLIHRIYRGILNVFVFEILDSLSFGLEMTGIMFMCAALLIFGSALIKERGSIKAAGRLFLVIALSCMSGALLINLSPFLPSPRFFYNLGMFFYAGVGVLTAIFTCGLLFVIFRRRAIPA